MAMIGSTGPWASRGRRPMLSVTRAASRRGPAGLLRLSISSALTAAPAIHLTVAIISMSRFARGVCSSRQSAGTLGRRQRRPKRVGVVPRLEPRRSRPAGRLRLCAGLCDRSLGERNRSESTEAQHQQQHRGGLHLGCPGAADYFSGQTCRLGRDRCPNRSRRSVGERCSHCACRQVHRQPGRSGDPCHLDRRQGHRQRESAPHEPLV